MSEDWPRPQRDRYVERLFTKGVRNVRHFFNFEGIAEKYGGEAYHVEGMPSVLASAVRFPTPEIAHAAWEDIYKHLNEVQDDIERGNAVTLEFGDSNDPNEPYITEAGKLAHIQKFRKSYYQLGTLSIHEEELVEKGVIGKFNPNAGVVRVLDVDNYRYDPSNDA